MAGVPTDTDGAKKNANVLEGDSEGQGDLPFLKY
jgi:hypothetical protein